MTIIIYNCELNCFIKLNIMDDDPNLIDGEK